MVGRCRGETRDHKPCAARPLPGRDVCPWHDDELAQRRREWSAEGGRRRASVERAKKLLGGQALTADDLLAELTPVFRGVISGDVDPKVGHAAIAIARGINEIRSSTELERRLEALEQVAAEQRGGGRWGA